jgi:hypothetical protein
MRVGKKWIGAYIYMEGNMAQQWRGVRAEERLGFNLHIALWL